ncbi:MAG: hypothetical protein K1X89_21250 [Myxococcaceae bacterium]|nr:hypothetical protein [Myxococcaceae bacterium]
MKRALLGLLVLLGCEAPPVDPGADPRQATRLSRIEGQVVVSSAARGNVVLFLYDAARPPPPTGTGRPVSFAVLGREAVFGAAADGDLGPFTAPYAFSLVAPGRYLVRGFIDVKGDFIPWYGVTAEPNQGDVGGAAVEPTTRAPRVIEVSADAPSLDVPVSFGDAAVFPFDRPAFSPQSASLELSAGGAPQVLTLSPLPVDDGLIHQKQPVFLARFVDDDGDGVADDANKDGVPDLWPKVLVRKLAGDSGLLDENDVDHNGVLDLGGADYEHLNPADGSTVAADGKSDAVVLAAGFDPSPFAAQLFDAQGKVKATPTPVSALKLVVRPQAFDVSDPRSPAPLKSLPKGRYAITVLQLTGQSWRVPNELSSPYAEALGFPSVASQAFVVTVR